MDKQQEFLKKLLETFRIEADEGLKKMSENLLKLEKKPSESETAELVELIFREAHSLKGASRAVNLLEIESVCQSFESVMSALKNKIIELKPQIFDILYQSIDLINEILNSLETGIVPETKDRITEIIHKLSKIESGASEENEVILTTEIDTDSEKETRSDINQKNVKKKSEPTVFNEKENRKAKSNESIENNESIDTKKNQASGLLKSSPDETIRVSTKKLDNLLFQSEEMLSLKIAAFQQTKNLNDILDQLYIWKKEASGISNFLRNVKLVLEKKEKKEPLSKEEQEISKIIQFSDWSVSHFKKMEDELIESKKYSLDEAYSSSLKIETLLDDVKEIITVPFSLAIDTFPKFIRDISKETGKKIDLVIMGEDQEVDRRILESIRQPLMHIIRNCIDYGIEKPDVRLKFNKPQTGTIEVMVERLENNKIRVQISDDGAGVNIEKLRNLYIKNERVSKEEALKIPENELLYYIFRSGVTTSEIVTDMSGRGLGLAIVQEKIEQLGGTIYVNSENNRGTTFKIDIPLTLVTFRGILIKVANNEFIVPTTKIQKVLRLNKSEIKTIEDKETIPFDGQIIPFVNLCDILELSCKETDSEYVQVLILGSSHQKIGFAIDQIMEEQEVLVKNFNKHIERLRNVSGATVLGSGKVVPILNIYDLIKSAGKPGISKTKQRDYADTSILKKSVLVVEDSITSRTLLKNILQSAGYAVTTAIDGIDGFTKLKEKAYNAVISDIEMPRMNGFDLTSKIRADKDLSEMPVILVTSLSKTEDKEKGIEAGANAYIIKSSFDQSNLLEILERLI